MDKASNKMDNELKKMPLRKELVDLMTLRREVIELVESGYMTAVEANEWYQRSELTDLITLHRELIDLVEGCMTSAEAKEWYNRKAEQWEGGDNNG